MTIVMVMALGELLEEAVEMLVSSCWIAVATFTARRYEETLSLTQESLQGNDVDGWWLNCVIIKPKRKREWLPVPLLVARAADVLKELDQVVDVVVKVELAGGKRHHPRWRYHD